MIIQNTSESTTSTKEASVIGEQYQIGWRGKLRAILSDDDLLNQAGGFLIGLNSAQSLSQALEKHGIIFPLEVLVAEDQNQALMQYLISHAPRIRQFLIDKLGGPNEQKVFR